MAKYNLLRDEFTNPTFAVIFDFRQRPHFIIQPNSVNTEFSLITNEQKQHLIEAGKSALACFEINRGFLSIHFGSWRTNTDQFHAHICVEAENYLEIYRNRKEEICNPDWKEPGIESHEKNVRAFPRKSFLEPDLKAIGTIHNLLDAEGEVTNEDGTQKIVYHKKYPMIGFVGKKPISNQVQNVFSAMEKFVKEHVLTKEDPNRKDKKPGCHICLYLGSVRTDDWIGLENNEEVVGYIVTTGFIFCKLCPKDHRGQWLDNYKQSDFKCST